MFDNSYRPRFGRLNVALDVLRRRSDYFCPTQKKFNKERSIKMYDNSAHGFCSLERKDFVKFLGILIDCNLKWKHHIDFISLKISKTIGILARLRHFVPTETLVIIYRSLIMPYLSYGICVWGRAAKSYMNKLLVLQKRALRLIYFAPSDAHVIPLFIGSKILPVNMIFFDMVANLMHDIWKGLASLPIRALVTRSNEIHGYNTRHAAKGNYIGKEAKLEIFKRSFSRTGAMLWNEISPNWRDVAKPTFKKTIRRFLFETLSDRDDYVEVDTLTQFLKSYMQCLINFNLFSTFSSGNVFLSNSFWKSSFCTFMAQKFYLTNKEA